MTLADNFRDVEADRLGISEIKVGCQVDSFDRLKHFARPHQGNDLTSLSFREARNDERSPAARALSQCRHEFPISENTAHTNVGLDGGRQGTL
jgi:hypothetical protein